jgi:putative transcriptional regulator
MINKNRYKSDASEAIHTSASALHKVRAIDEATMRDCDARHLAVPSVNRTKSSKTKPSKRS